MINPPSLLATKSQGLLIHRFGMKIPGGRKSFEILLPGDCEQVTGILVLTDPSQGFLNWVTSTSQWNDNIAGHISFRYYGIGDVFFMEKVIVESDFDIYTVMGLDPPNKHFPDLAHIWTNGRKYAPRAVNVPGNNRVISGFYKDVMNAISVTNESYTVTVYLYYERKRPAHLKQMQSTPVAGNHVSDRA
jgi:hypothetical protein